MDKKVSVDRDKACVQFYSREKLHTAYGPSQVSSNLPQGTIIKCEQGKM